MWDILGIAATADERAIRRAYAARLKALGRTPDPQQFARLRQAYEQALYEAEHGAPEVQEWDEPSARDEESTTGSGPTPGFDDAEVPVSGEATVQSVAPDDGTPIFFQAPLAAPARRSALNDDTEPPDVFAPTRPQALLEAASFHPNNPADSPATQGFEPTRPLALLDVDVTSQLSPRDAYLRGSALAKGLKPSLAAAAIEAVLREDDFIALDLRRAFEMGLLEGLIDAIPEPDLIQAVIATMDWEPALNPRNEVDARINWLFEGLRIGLSWRELQEQARNQPMLAVILSGKTPQELGWRRWAPGLRVRVGHALSNANRPEFSAARRHPQFPDENFQRWNVFAQSAWLGIDPVWPRSTVAGAMFGLLGVWLACLVEDERNLPFYLAMQWYEHSGFPTIAPFFIAVMGCIAMARGSCWLVDVMDPADQHGQSSGPRYARLWKFLALSSTVMATAFALLPTSMQWLVTGLIFIAAWFSWPLLGRALTVWRSIWATALMALVGPILLGAMYDNPPAVIAYMLAPTLCIAWIFGRGMVQAAGLHREMQWSFAAAVLSLVLLAAVFLPYETAAPIRLVLDLGFIVILVGQSHDFLERLSRMISAFSQTGKFIAYLISVFVLSICWFAMVDYLNIDVDKTLIRRSPGWPALVAVLGFLHAWQAVKLWRESRPSSPAQSLG